MTQTADTLENLAKSLPVEKTLDFIQFRSAFINHYDFEKVRDMAQSSQTTRTGSRSTSWKVRGPSQFILKR